MASSYTPEERDIALIRAGGLRMFTRLAWKHAEPNADFSDNWHIGVISRELQAISSGENRRTLINQPPGTTKSLMTGCFWIAWDWIDNPWRSWFFASYSQALLNDTTTKLERLLRSEWYIARWGHRLPPTIAISDFDTLQGGGRFNTSFGGGGTGRHAHIQVIDDPIKPRDANGGAAVTKAVLDKTRDTFANTFASRAKDPKTFARVIVMQRIHEDDLTGYALAQGGWRHVRLPLLCEEKEKHPEDPRVEGEALDKNRHDVLTVEQIKKDMGPDTFATQAQQRPTVPGGQIIREEWLKPFAVDLEYVRQLRGVRKQSWDLTFKNTEHSDFVAGQWWLRTFLEGKNAKGDTIKEAHYFLCDEPVFAQLGFVETISTIRSKRLTWPSTEILIEDKANGPAVESVLRGEIPNLRMLEPLGSKISRAHACAPLAADGKVHLLRGPSHDRMIKTLTQFPRVRHDDEVDALTQALLEMKKAASFEEAMRVVRGEH